VRIVIVGAGVVGTATGKGFILGGHDVRFVDTSPLRVEALRAEGLEASVGIELHGPRTLVMLSVPTPSTAQGYDLTAIRAAVGAVGDVLLEGEEPSVVILRSTVAPGTLERVVAPILEERSGRGAGDGFLLASNPEFLRAVSAQEDFLNPGVTVVGSRSEEARDLLTELYLPFGGALRTFTDPAEAEFIKLAHNVFNATKISFFNELWSVATAIGIDADAAAEVLAHSAEASWNPSYGIRGGRPFGGACLPKDLSGFIAFARQVGCPATMAEAVRAVNDSLARIDPAAMAGAVEAMSSGTEATADQPAVDLRDGALVDGSSPWRSRSSVC
jgi:UDPglucose 6-dehydrogenase